MLKKLIKSEPIDKQLSAEQIKKNAWEKVYIPALIRGNANFQEPYTEDDKELAEIVLGYTETRESLSKIFPYVDDTLWKTAQETHKKMLDFLKN